jgi:hypothetical protein
VFERPVDLGATEATFLIGEFTYLVKNEIEVLFVVGLRLW